MEQKIRKKHRNKYLKRKNATRETARVKTFRVS